MLIQLWRPEFELDGINSGSWYHTHTHTHTHTTVLLLFWSMSGTTRVSRLVPLLNNQDISFMVRGRLYSSYVQSSILHGSETWPIRKANEVALQRAVIRMVRWMCGIKLQDRVPSKGLREKLGLDDIISVLLENRLHWYGLMLRKEDEYEMEGARPRGRPKKTWREIVEKDYQARKLNREDAMDHNRWRKQIRDD